MIIDEYQTIEHVSTGLYREKGSKFLAVAHPFDNVEMLDTILDPLKKEHPKARHHCYSYEVGVDGNTFRINDDGEPAGSAGRPIMSQIKSNNITNVIIIVTRYFGGTKLGVPGLIHAYKTAAQDALSQNNIITKYLYDQFEIKFEYAHLGETLNVLKHLDIPVLDKTYDTGVNLQIGIRKSLTEDTLLNMKAKLLKKSIEEVASMDSIEGFEITKIAEY